MTGPRDTGEAAHPGADPLPAEVERGRDDGVLDSIGKAIAAPVEGAAEDDEPKPDAGKPPVPPG